MKKSTSCRRFYILMFLMVVITYQYVDFHAANNALTFTKNIIHKNVEKPISATVQYHAETVRFSPFLTHPFATILVACMGLIFFFYKPADKLLNLLHKSRGIYSCIGLVCIFILLSTANHFIVAETLFIFLLAAYFYKPKITDNFPDGRKAMPEGENEQKSIKLAA